MVVHFIASGASHIHACVHAVTGAMSALQRHQHQVKYILDRGYVAVMEPDMESGQLKGLFSCVSVKHSKTIKYAGCIGELLCECPQARYDVCKHLEAAAKVLPFTHAMRLKAAEALVDHLHAVDLEKGVILCRQVNLHLKPPVTASMVITLL